MGDFLPPHKNSRVAARLIVCNLSGIVSEALTIHCLAARETKLWFGCVMPCK